MKWPNAVGRWYYRRRYREVKYVEVTDVPADLPPGLCCVAVDRGVPWAVSLRCPCGCGDAITLNLVGSHPVWRLSLSANAGVTLHPSVWRTSACESHFWVRQGRVVWARAHWRRNFRLQAAFFLKRLIYRR